MQNAEEMNRNGPEIGPIATNHRIHAAPRGINKFMPRRAVSSNGPNGFTLIEILVVLIIISVLAGIVTVSVMRKPGEARVAAAKMQVQQIKTAVNMYKAEQGRLPTQQQGLETLVRKPVLDPIPREYPAEGYLDSPAVPKDPWGNDYIYLTPGSRNEPFEIISYGNDGEAGGEGDAADISSSGSTGDR